MTTGKRTSTETLGWLIAGGGALGTGLVAASGGVAALGALPWLFCSGMGGSLVLIARSAARISRAETFFTEGDLASADALLAKPMWPWHRDAYSVLRGAIALERADPRRALVELDDAVARSRPHAFAPYTRAVAALARARRAVVRAILGDADGARADIAAARGQPGVPVHSLAMSALAETLVAARSGDRDALRARLADNRGILRELSWLRGRALARGLSRLAHAPRGSAYRSSGKLDTSSDLRRWADDLFPEVSPFIEIEIEVGEPLAIRATRGPSELRARVVPVPPPPPKSSTLRRALMLWGGLVLFFVVVWQFVGPDGAPGPAPAPASPSSGLAVGVVQAVLTLLFGVAVVVIFRRARRDGATLAAASVAASLGHADEARAVLAPLVDSRQPLMAASARSILADVAERAGDLKTARQLLDQAITAANGVRTAGAEYVLAAMYGQRAMVRAALGDEAGVREDLATLEQRFPDTLARSTAVLPSELRLAARRGDWSAAAAIAERRKPTTALSYRDDLIADIAMVASGKVRDPAEMSRLLDDLADDPSLSAWVDTLAPGARAAIERAAVQ